MTETWGGPLRDKRTGRVIDNVRDISGTHPSNAKVRALTRQYSAMASKKPLKVQHGAMPSKEPLTPQYNGMTSRKRQSSDTSLREGYRRKRDCGNELRESTLIKEHSKFFHSFTHKSLRHERGHLDIDAISQICLSRLEINQTYVDL